jgi:hypothetical protein
MNPFFFVRYQSQQASSPLTFEGDASRKEVARKELLRRDLESRNQGLYSWNQDLNISRLYADSVEVEMVLGKLGRLIKTEWSLVLAVLMLLTGLSLVSFQIFVVLVSLIAIGVMFILGQQSSNPGRGMMTETYALEGPVVSLNDPVPGQVIFETTRPRFIPLTQSKSTQSRMEKVRRQLPRQYRLNPSPSDSRHQVS